MKRKKDALYRCTSNDTLEEVHVLGEKIEGKTVQEHLNAITDMQKQIKELRTEVKRREREENELLNRAGVPRLDLVQVINPNKRYVIIKVDEKDIIEKIATINNSSIVVEMEKIPQDIVDGYYRYNKKTKQVELDSELKEILYDL